MSPRGELSSTESSNSGPFAGIPLKDENNHEPTVQARQHHSSHGHGHGGVKTVVATHGGSGPRTHGNVHTTPLEIGMYVLLAAFCFAIVVFVVSCVVYASKFSPHTLEAQPAHQVSAPFLFFFFLFFFRKKIIII